MEPWKTEPDYKEFNQNGFHFVIKRNSLGALCGYLGFPNEHPFHGISGDVLDYYFTIHGGFTFSGYLSETRQTWYVGFDCSHYNDFTPSLPPLSSNDPKNYKTMRFVARELLQFSQSLSQRENELRLRFLFEKNQ